MESLEQMLTRLPKAIPWLGVKLGVLLRVGEACVALERLSSCEWGGATSGRREYRYACCEGELCACGTGEWNAPKTGEGEAGVPYVCARVPYAGAKEGAEEDACGGKGVKIAP